MDEYTASYFQIEKIRNAIQCMKECLVCRICLELFKEPVTIKCGHKFCKNCILKVTNKDHAGCPFCNIKIDKRSIPKQGNELLQSTVYLLNNLVQAIYQDSGINALQPSKNLKHTKESIVRGETEYAVVPKNVITTFEKSSSTTNEKKSTSTLNCVNNEISDSQRKKMNNEVNSESNKNSSIAYFVNKPDYGPNQVVHTEEKVKSWLENITQDANIINNNISSEDIDYQPIVLPSCNKVRNSKFDAAANISLEKEQKHIKTQGRMGKNKKLNHSPAEESILKTPSSVPAAFHSDDNNWRRVKRVGKEMQAKKFKSLNVSIEKNSSSMVLDDTLPCYSTTNDSKSCREVDANNYSSQTIPSLVTKPLDINYGLQQKENIRNTNHEYSNIIHSINSSNSIENENISTHCIDQNKVNEIIGILPLKDNLNTPERTRNLSVVSNSELVTKLKQLSPLKEKSYNKQQNSELFDGDLSSYDTKTDIVDVDSPTKQKLSLKVKPTTSKLISPNSRTSDNVQLKNFSPEKSKRKLSLELPSVKSNELFSNQTKYISKSSNTTDFSQSNHSIITFKKLGKMCRKKKNISFLLLGRLRPKIRVINNLTKQQTSAVVIKSDKSVNFDYNLVMKNTHLKVNSSDSLQINDNKHIRTKEEVKVVSNDKVLQNKKNMCFDLDKVINNNILSLEIQSNMLMDIDEPTPSTSKASMHQSVIKKNARQENMLSTSIQNSDELNRNYHKESRTLHKETADADIEIEKKCKTEISENNVKQSEINKINNAIDKYSINVNSDETESVNTQVTVKIGTPEKDENKNGNSDVESNADSHYASTHKLKEKDFEEVSVGTSTSSSLITSNKKRTHSESSNEDVSCIIDKWYPSKEQPTIKKQKTIFGAKVDLNLDKQKNIDDLRDFFSDGNDYTTSNNTPKTPKTKIHEIVDNVQCFKENVVNVNKLADVPSSLLSADLFESNEQCIQQSIESTIEPLQINSNNRSSINAWSANKNSDEECLDSNLTMLDLMQFNKNEFNVSVCSDSSNKENNACNHVQVNSVRKHRVDNVEDQIDPTENDQNNKSTAIINNTVCNEFNAYHISDSLMNITQEQLAMKKIEKDLIGVNLSEIHAGECEKINESNKFSTPRHKSKCQVDNTDDEFETDNIDATPVSSKRRLPNFRTALSITSSERNKSNVNSPETNLNLIPALTPMKNTKSYPLSHSTPMVNTLETENKLRSKIKSMTLICSGLPLDNIKVVQAFAKQFGANFQSNFTMEITHVIVQTDTETKAGQKTFKYLQGIAFKKCVVSFDWVVDCLKQNKLLDENNEKYEVLDPDNFECGSKKSCTRTQELFEEFAFYCEGPFDSFSLNEFKNLMLYNGATIVSTPKELSLQEDKYKIVILESENLSANRISTLKKSKAALISFEWVVDSISQYQVLSLLPYLYEMTVDEALAMGFPSEYFVEDETIEDGEL